MNSLISRYIYSGLLGVMTIFLTVLMIFQGQCFADSGTITGSVVNVRSGPGTNYGIAGNLYQDTKVEIISQNGEWLQIKFGSVSGWLHKSLVRADQAAAGFQLAVNRDQVNLRSGPGTTYSIIGEAERGDQLTLIDVADEWYKVKTASGLVAFIRSDMTGADNINSVGRSAAATTAQNSSTNGTSVNTSNSKAPGIIMDGQEMQFEVSPVIVNNRVLVPLRAIFEAMGATVIWNQGTQTATATRGDIEVILPLNSTQPTVNGQVWSLDVPAKVVNQRTLAPLRFVGEALGGTAAWDSANNQVVLTSPSSGHGAVVAIVITANTVNLRSEPVVNNSNVVGSASYGERLQVVDKSNGWYQVIRNGEEGWVAGWLVDVVREGDPSAAPVSSPIIDPTPVPEVTLAGLTIASERTSEGLRIIMESGQKLSPEIDKSSGQLRYEFANRKIEGTAAIDKYLLSDKLTVMGTNSGSSAIVTIKFPAGVSYETDSENNGKREIFTIPNYIAAISRKTFSSSGENITVNSIAPLEYTSTPSSTKLEVVFKDCALGKAQSSYRYSSPLISSMSFRNQTTSGQNNTVLTITTSKPVKFSVGTSDEDCTLNILFVDKTLIESRTPIVVLDAGHGGRDPGASGDELSEKDINLKLVLKAGKILTSKGIKVVYTRQDDTYVGLDERTTMANLLNAAIFVSVHNNANVSSAPSGTETYCYYPLSDPELYMQKEERYNLALRLQEALVDKLGRIDRGVKQANLAVLRESQMPSALVEMVFISNPAEEKLLQKASFLDLGSQAIAEAISSYMKSYVSSR